jgi:hypothetical protein
VTVALPRLNQVVAAVRHESVARRRAAAPAALVDGSGRIFDRMGAPGLLAAREMVPPLTSSG